MVNCVDEWECAKINKAQVKAYGLGDVIAFNEPESADALFASLEDAYERGEPWLGYMWGPTITATKLDLTRLVEPRNSEICWNSDNGKACAYPVSKVRILVHPSLLALAPDVMEFLRKWELDTGTQGAVEEHFTEHGKSFDKTVTWFLKNHEAVWINWVTSEASQRLKNALEDS